MKIKKTEKNEIVQINEDFYLELKKGRFYELDGDDSLISIYNYKPKNEIEEFSNKWANVKIFFSTEFPEGHGPKDIDITSLVNGFYEENNTKFEKKYIGQLIATVGESKKIVKVLIDNNNIKTGYCSHKSVIDNVPILNRQLVVTLVGYILTRKGIYIAETDYNYTFGMPDVIEELMDEILLSISAFDAKDKIKTVENELKNIPSTKNETEELKNRIEDLKIKWVKECEDIKEKKKQELEKYTKDTRKKYGDMIVKIQENIEKEIVELEIKKKEKETKLKAQEKELENLGVFKFRTKEELKKNIASDRLKIDDFEKIIRQKEEEKKNLKQKLEKECEDEIYLYEKDLSNKYQLPVKPKELLTASDFALTRTQKENELVKEKIIEWMIKIARPVTVTDLVVVLDNEITNQKISALLNQLVNENKVDKILDGKKTYFIIK